MLYLYIHIFYFLLAAFFGLLAFLAVGLLRAVFAGAAALLLEAVVDAAGAVAVAACAVAGFELLLVDFAAAFFFGDAAFFFGLLALALPPDFGLAAALAFGLAVRAEIIKKRYTSFLFLHSTNLF
jgi:hypothetical protein